MSLNLLAHDFAGFLFCTYSLRHDSATKLELQNLNIFRSTSLQRERDSNLITKKNKKK
jgi:hypothetical protein